MNTNEEKVEKIIQITSEITHFPVEQIKGISRKRELVDARRIAMSLSLDITDASLPSLARYFHKKNHSCILHARDQTKDLRSTNELFSTTYLVIKERVLREVETSQLERKRRTIKKSTNPEFILNSKIKSLLNRKKKLLKRNQLINQELTNLTQLKLEFINQ